ncbi:hypothetical protein, partial [Xanthobacter pseudotagetidis]|uniref:hypothetical protein n=1 Tax=Xanthobacter pseudotagetidis TaxID=3119911 RepID=UPI00372BAED6
SWWSSDHSLPLNTLESRGFEPRAIGAKLHGKCGFCKRHRRQTRTNARFLHVRVRKETGRRVVRAALL